MKMLRIVTLVVCLQVVAFAQDTRTADDLIKQILAGFEAKDQSALASLTISELEYKAYIWPRVSARNSGVKVEKFYALYRQASDSGLSAGLKQYGGQRWQMVKVEPGTVISQGRDYRLMSAPTVIVRGSDGSEKTIRPVGAVLEHQGTFKVATYSVTPKADTK